MNNLQNTSINLGLRSVFLVLLLFVLPTVLQVITSPLYDNWASSDPGCQTGMIGLACIGAWMGTIYVINILVFIVGCILLKKYISKASRQNPYIIIAAGIVFLLLAVIISMAFHLASPLPLSFVLFPTAIVGTFLLLEETNK